jgi:copper chaperone CopZ
MKTIELKVPNLKCMGCVNTVINNLTKINGVISVNSNLSTKTVNVEYNEINLTVDKIAKLLETIGYPVEK